MRRIFPPSGTSARGYKKVGISVLLGAFCILAGILIAANLDLSSPAVADTPVNIAQTGALPVVERYGQLESPFVAIVEKTQAAVVNISARTREQVLPWWLGGPSYATSTGSGFFFRKDGYILTNNHVVNNASTVRVRTASGYEYEADVVGTDPETDLAVLKIRPDPEEEIAVIPFGDSDALKVGDWAIAIGNPFPQLGLDRTVTVGVVSAIGRSNLYFGRETPQYQYYIQTDATINPGNSGGPLLNLRGECIGVNAAISTPTGASVGIGFAIPINLARAVVPDLIAYGRPKRGWLGIWLSPVTLRDAKRQGLHAVKGVKVDSVFAHSPADQAGLRSGDIIVALNGQEVESPSRLSVMVSTIDAGTPISVEVVRNGEHQTYQAVIADRDAFLASLSHMSEPADDDIITWMGMELTTFTRDIARALGTDFVPGVYVQGVYAGSPADRASITKGTIILQIDKRSITSLEDVKEVARRGSGADGRFALIVQEPDGTIARKVIRER